MLKKLIYIFLLITLFIFSVSCNKAPDNVSEENQPSIKDVEAIKNPVINIVTEDLIEMRNFNLWLNKKELYRLSLDDEPFVFPEEILQDINFSHVIINYPLLVLNTNNVYNLEEKKLVFTGEDIVSSLEEVWGKTMGVNGVNPYGDDLDLEPKHFDFIDNLSLSPSKERIAFSIHHYATAMTTTITGIFKIEDSKIEFVEGPDLEEINNITWSPNEDYFAYTSSSDIDEYEINILVINSTNLKKVVTLTSTELFKEELKDIKLQGDVYITGTLLEWNNGYLDVKLRYTGTEDNIEKELIKSIEYKQ